MTVTQIQLLLAYLGYEPGRIDGVMGINTKAAIRAFQRAEGLDADGIPGEKTQSKLKEAVFRGRKKTEPAPEEPVTGDWWKEIRYFARSEPYIACSCGRCGGFPVEPTERLMRLADRVRQEAGRPMIPTSTVRCKAHNAEVGGVSNSRHLYGKAMDFSISGWNAERSLALVKKQKELRYAYAIDETHVHIDVE